MDLGVRGFKGRVGLGVQVGIDARVRGGLRGRGEDQLKPWQTLKKCGS